MENGWTERIKELEAENRRLVALNDTFPPEIARLEDRISEEYEAERADDRARIKELEAENKRLKAELAEAHSRLARQQYADLQLCGKRDEKIRHLENELAEAREALRKALPRMAHRFECVSILPSEMWHQNGSVSLDSCVCEIKVVKAALKAAEVEG